MIMKKLFSVFLLSLVLVLGCSLSAKAKVQVEKNLTVYIQTPSASGTIRFNSPAVETVSMTNSTAIVNMEDYLYIGGILLDFNVEGINASQVRIVCNDAQYSKTLSLSSNIREFIPLSTAKSTSIYLIFSK